MRRMIRCMVPAVSVALIAATVWAVSEDAATELDKSATQVAKAWFASLMQGETAVTTSLSAVPFLFDGKHEVKTLQELKEIYDGVVGDKGRRNLKPASATVTSSSPQKIVVVITIQGDDEKIAVTVKPGEAFHVVGFRD